MRRSVQIDNEFKELEEKIQKSKQIEKELSSLEVKGFEPDILKIKSELKYLDIIDQIEMEFKWLKNRISEKREQERRQREEEEGRREERERSEIKKLIYQTENIIKKAIRDATNIKDSLWLSALRTLEADLLVLTQQFTNGEISYIDAKFRILDLKEQAEVLSTPPPKEEMFKEAKSEDETYYDILGVDHNVSQDKIKGAYFKKMKECHPDTTASWANTERMPKWVREKLEEMTKKLNEAYEILSDPDKRREYNKKIGM